MFLGEMEEEQELPFVWCSYCTRASESTFVRLCMSPVTVGCVEGQGLINNVMCETAMTAAVYRCSRESLERDR